MKDFPAAHRLGEAAGVDAARVLKERAAFFPRRGRGRVSRGGATRLVRAADGWMAVSLARPDDVDAVPAWLGIASVEEGVAGRGVDDLVERGRLLGLPVAGVGERGPGPLYERVQVGDAPPLGRPPLVVDLSSLWAGPLCTRILRRRGARVIKVESATRPDGARAGAPAFFQRLNSGKEQVRVPFAADALLPLLHEADVVVEGSRPRALEQLGIDAAAVVATGPRVWLSITGHGRASPQRDWVAFGDDAAAAGGLVRWDGDGPVFVGDAVADPLTGMAGAVAVGDALAAGGRWLIDCSLAGVAAYVAAA